MMWSSNVPNAEERERELMGERRGSGCAEAGEGEGDDWEFWDEVGGEVEGWVRRLAGEKIFGDMNDDEVNQWVERELDEAYF